MRLSHSVRGYHQLIANSAFPSGVSSNPSVMMTHAFFNYSCHEWRYGPCVKSVSTERPKVAHHFQVGNCALSQSAGVNARKPRVTLIATGKTVKLQIN